MQRGVILPSFRKKVSPRNRQALPGPQTFLGTDFPYALFFSSKGLPKPMPLFGGERGVGEFGREADRTGIEIDRLKNVAHKANIEKTGSIKKKKTALAA